MTDWKVPPTQLVANAFIKLLKDNLSRVFDSTVPPDTEFPYHVVHVIPGGGWGGPPLDDPEADMTLVFQVDSVGRRRDQAMFAADQASRVVVGRTDGALDFQLPSVPGWNECARMRNDVPGGVVPEGAPPNAVYTVPNRYEVVVTPA